MMKSRYSIAATIAAGMLVLTGCAGGGSPAGPSDSGDAGGADGAPVTIVVAHTGNPGGSISDFFDTFATMLEEESNGQIIAEVHGAGELGGDQQLVESLRLGSVGIASAATSNMAQYTDAYTWADLPYIFEDYESADRLWASALRDELDAQVQETLGTHVLGYVNAGGYRVVANANRDVLSLDDMAGMKLRTTDAPLEAALTRAWGANPVPIAWADTFSAVQQGVVDGLQLQPEWLNLNGFSAAVSHVTEVEALMAFHVVQMSDVAWNSLDAEQQELVMDVAQRASDEANAQMIDDYASHLETLEADGVTVSQLADDELERFREAAVATWDDFDNQELLQRAQDAQQE